jgi:hypothetical protein
LTIEDKNKETHSIVVFFFRPQCNKLITLIHI